MSRSCVHLYVHIIWTTWPRSPLITPEWEGEVYACISDKCRELQCELLAIGGIEDHVHLLVRLNATVSIAQLVKNLKGTSSHLMTHRVAPDSDFKWQRGYGAISVSVSHVRRVSTYIQNQKQHHAHNNLWPNLETANDS